MILTLDLRLPAAKSLKDRRTVVSSIKEKLKNKYELLINEKKENDNFKKSSLYIVGLSSDKNYLYKIYEKLTDYIISNYEVLIVDENIEMMVV